MKIEEYKEFMQDLDDGEITKLLLLWKAVTLDKKNLEELEKTVRDKVKAYLKERKWNRYVDDDTKISANLFKVQIESFDKLQLKIMLSSSQYQQALKVNEVEKLSIMLPETREKLKKFVKKRKG